MTAVNIELTMTAGSLPKEKKIQTGKDQGAVWVQIDGSYVTSRVTKEGAPKESKMGQAPIALRANIKDFDAIIGDLKAGKTVLVFGHFSRGMFWVAGRSDFNLDGQRVSDHWPVQQAA